MRAAKYRGILGINIGKNFDTPIERAADDYLACLDKVYALASYVTVNISSPNTKNLRQLQGESELDDLLGRLKAAQTRPRRHPRPLRPADPEDRRPTSTTPRSATSPTRCAATASTA